MPPEYRRALDAALLPVSVRAYPGVKLSAFTALPMIQLELLLQRIDTLCSRLRLRRRPAGEVKRQTQHASERQYGYYDPAWFVADLIAAYFVWEPPDRESCAVAARAFVPILNGGEPTPEQLADLASRGRVGALLVRRLSAPLPTVRSKRPGLNDVDFVALDQRIGDLCVRLALIDTRSWHPRKFAKEQARRASFLRSPAECAARVLADHLEMQRAGRADRKSAWQAQAKLVFAAILEGRALTPKELRWLNQSDRAAIRALGSTNVPKAAP
jgi:hypothetical protein